ncbi:hypothetical protein D3C75_795470 [compost metagenome]
MKKLYEIRFAFFKAQFLHFVLQYLLIPHRPKHIAQVNIIQVETLQQLRNIPPGKLLDGGKKGFLFPKHGLQHCYSRLSHIVLIAFHDREPGAGWAGRVNMDTRKIHFPAHFVDHPGHVSLWLHYGQPQGDPPLFHQQQLVDDRLK